MPIPAGMFNRRVEIWRDYGATNNAFNEPVENWVLAMSVWAGLNHRSATERASAGRYEATRIDVFTVRLNPTMRAIDPALYRLNYQGRFYNILGLTEVGDREALDIIAETRAD